MKYLLPLLFILGCDDAPTEPEQGICVSRWYYGGLENTYLACTDGECYPTHTSGDVQVIQEWRTDMTCEEFCEGALLAYAPPDIPPFDCDIF